MNCRRFDVEFDSLRLPVAYGAVHFKRSRGALYRLAII